MMRMSANDSGTGERNGQNVSAPLREKVLFAGPIQPDIDTQQQIQDPIALTTPRKKTYGQILKSSALIGSSSVMNVGFGMVRNKAMAIFLGPSGYLLLGLYTSIIDVTRTIAGMGLNSSGVRQIAEASGAGDSARIACAITTLRRLSLLLGLLGGLSLCALCVPISRLTFGDTTHAGSVALLGLAVLLMDVSAGQAALVQGMRQISALATMSVLGAFYGALFSIPIVYFLREQGVVPSLICVAAMGIVTSWWHARKIKVEKVALPWSRVFAEARTMLGWGAVFMVSALLTVGGQYLIRILLMRRTGEALAGCYTAAWGLSGYYVGFILQAMGADFFPRLTAAANNHEECNRLVNEQAEVGFLIAGPAMLCTLAVAPLAIDVFYSDKFAPAGEVLRWLCLGMSLRVLTWPMGFILLAKARQALFFWSELVSNAVYLGLVWLCVHYFGMIGAGMGFVGFYLFYFVLILTMVRNLTGFAFSGVNIKLMLTFLPLMAGVAASWYFLPHKVAAMLGLTGGLLTGIYSLRKLSSMVSHDRLPKPIRKILALFAVKPKPDHV